MRYSFLIRCFLKTSILIIILVLVLNAFYATISNKATRKLAPNKLNNVSPFHDFDYGETFPSSSISESVKIESITKRDFRVNVQTSTIRKEGSPVKRKMYEARQTIKQQTNANYNNNESSSGTMHNKYASPFVEIREEDYMDLEQVSRRRVITDRFMELREYYDKHNKPRTYDAKKSELMRLDNYTWKTQPLTCDNEIFAKSLGSLWRPAKSPEMDQDDRFVSQLIWQMEAVNNSIVTQNKVKKILIYDSFKWWGNKDWSGQEKQLNCLGSFNQCIAVEKTNSMKDIDAVITVRDAFHTKNLIVPSNVFKINFILESPLASSAHLFRTNDLLASYWRGSDIVTPYSKWIYYDPAVRRKEQQINYAKGKTKTAAVFMSNCQGFNNRLGYIRSLQKYVTVDIYGDCGTENCPRSHANSCFQMLSKVYRFYLAFENANCRDYISEKFHENALRNNIVPVVLGAHPEDYKTVAPYNSYIHVEDFDSPQELAVYLKYLEENEEEYNKFFEWKGTGEFIFSDFFCRACGMIHYADAYPPPERDKAFLWHGKESNMCLDAGRWYWTKPNHQDGSLNEIL